MLGAFIDLVEDGRATDTSLPDRDPGHMVMIHYTSGTTGFPKGALRHHRGLEQRPPHNGAQPDAAGDVLLDVMPLFHTSGSVLAVLGAVACRSTLALVRGIRARPWARLDAIEADKWASDAAGVDPKSTTTS